MDVKEICPCVNLECPNHGNCEKCTSRHLHKGFLNFCGFHTILPVLQEAIDASPESPTAKKLADLIGKTSGVYDKLMEKHGISKEVKGQLLEKMAEFSDY
jgi:hypothetical protein